MDRIVPLTTVHMTASENPIARLMPNGESAFDLAQAKQDPPPPIEGGL
jgi:hypothetical protein